ncbi:MAG: glycosyltransferase [Candidatus Bathyarchaeia archaeon]
MSDDLDVSVVIRVVDMERNLKILLEDRLPKQSIKPRDIVVVDNFSNKEEKDLVGDYISRLDVGMPIVFVPISEFSHPYSLNIGIERAEGEFVATINGHCDILNRHWLELGRRHLADPEVAAVGGYYVSTREGSIWETICFTLPVRVATLAGYIVENGPISTVNAIIRKEVWEEVPFDVGLVDYGIKECEDWIWSKRVIERGYKTVLDPALSLIHFHGYSFRELYEKLRLWRWYCRRFETLRAMKIIQ